MGGGAMATRVEINHHKAEITRIKATFNARPVTDRNDDRVARINELNRQVRELSKLLPLEKLVGGKAKDHSRYFKPSRRLAGVRMGGAMATRVEINQHKAEITRIKATFNARPVTDRNDDRVARINELNRQV